MDKISAGDVVFYNDLHEALVTNLITEVLEDRGKTAVIRTRGFDIEVPKANLVKLPVDKDFPIYPITQYVPKYPSPD
jgi:hypothetical protein